MSNLEPEKSRDNQGNSPENSGELNRKLPSSGVNVSEEIRSYIRGKELRPEAEQSLLERISEHVRLYSKEIESQHLRGMVIPLDKVTSDKELQLLIQKNIQSSFPHSDYATTDFILQNSLNEFAPAEANELLSSVRKFHIYNALHHNQYQFSIMISDKDGSYICLDAEKMKKIENCLHQYIEAHSAEKIGFFSLEDVKKQFKAEAINTNRKPIKGVIERAREEYIVSEVMGKVIDALDKILLKRQHKLEQRMAVTAGVQQAREQDKLNSESVDQGEKIVRKFAGHSEQENNELILIQCLNSMLKRSNLNYFVESYRNLFPANSDEINSGAVISNYKTFLSQIKEYFRQYLLKDRTIVDTYKLFENFPRERWDIGHNPKFAEYMASETAKKIFGDNSFVWTDVHLQRAFREFSRDNDQIKLSDIARFDFSDARHGSLFTYFQIQADGRMSHYRFASKDEKMVEMLKQCLGRYTMSHLGKFSFIIEDH